MQTLIYAGQHMADDRQLMEYHVPPVGAACTCDCCSDTLPGALPPARQQQDCLCDLLVQGCQTMIAIETAKLKLGKPDRESAYWN